MGELSKFEVTKVLEYELRAADLAVAADLDADASVLQDQVCRSELRFRGIANVGHRVQQFAKLGPLEAKDAEAVNAIGAYMKKKSLVRPQSPLMDQ